MRTRYSVEAGGPAFETTRKDGAGSSWDPYHVWLTRVQQPREQRSSRRPPETERGAFSPSEGQSPAGQWNPWRRAASPRN
jgi:hypothetical protein